MPDMLFVLFSLCSPYLILCLQSTVTHTDLTELFCTRSKSQFHQEREGQQQIKNLLLIMLVSA